MVAFQVCALKVEMIRQLRPYYRLTEEHRLQSRLFEYRYLAAFVEHLNLLLGCLGVIRHVLHQLGLTQRQNIYAKIGEMGSFGKHKMGSELHQYKIL